MPEHKRQQAYKRGVWAESRAALFLMSKGYKILKRRYKTPVGEIDLVALKGEFLVIVEVKARDHMDDALYAIDPRTQKRIEEAMKYFLSRHPEFSAHAIRFDVIAVGGISMRHLDNAWQARS